MTVIRVRKRSTPAMPPFRLSNLRCQSILGCGAFLTLAALFSLAATLPPEFTETEFGSSLSGPPTAMEFAPDGRLFVCLQTGQMQVIKNGSLLATPFLSLSVDSSGERGLLGIAFDPNFSSNAINTANLVINSGTFAGWTINQLIAEADNIIGGCSNAYTPSQINEALTSFNENYDGGTTDNGFLACASYPPLSIECSATQGNCSHAFLGSA